MHLFFEKWVSLPENRRRTYRRIMSSSLDNNGIIYCEEGDAVTYTEVFRKE